MSQQMFNTAAATGVNWFNHYVLQSLTAFCTYLFTGMALVRWFGFACLMTTLALVNYSDYVNTLADGYKWLARCLVLLPGFLILPLPRPWPIKEALEEWVEKKCAKPWVRSMLHDFIKGGGAILCYYASNCLGDFLQIITDLCLIHATLSFTFFLLTLDLIYDFEETLEVCDNFVFACYGLMINKNQKRIKHLYVHITCAVVSFVKTFLRSNLTYFVSKIENKRGDIPTTINREANSGTIQATRSGTPPTNSGAPPPTQDISFSIFHGGEVKNTR